MERKMTKRKGTKDMALTLTDWIEGLQGSRRHLLAHMNGMRDDQWDWKAGPGCKSVRETLAHLVVDDRAALQSLTTGGEPDYEGLSQTALAEAGGDLTRQREILDASFAQLIAHLQAAYADTPLDVEVSVWGAPMKLARAIAYFSSEDFYHAGQIAYIRLATDPDWNYYADIYGAG